MKKINISTKLVKKFKCRPRFFSIIPQELKDSITREFEKGCYTFYSNVQKKIIRAEIDFDFLGRMIFNFTIDKVLDYLLPRLILERMASSTGLALESVKI